jgi:hypothetical protein
MNDKELLELAAKAAGNITFEDCFMQNPAIYGKREWNPLTDDGDALRLAVKLEILNTRPNGYEWPNIDLFNQHKDDPYAATRRAIVRASAEIGKGIQQKTTQNLPEDNFYKTEAEACYGAAEIGKSK